ncbi:cobalamin biosynthesis protein CobD [Thiospirochaeta perfilievii]|uniref:Cobalamin biosynthesis protein CobD n=1 Tax=Thiospirochaeta perfilievii TaxID=252967 RepID=A0A5C1QD20_9SPIO|nr:adenosylcobinamide-phosphate synthase CbiB [Thiospirochaeta perfilievii]QEN04102.1 cobalamin biosynthesis protein CobD [Thiospirochaeta perfilievii]
MGIVIPLIAGYILDIIFGDPHSLPHPIRFIGLLIEKVESLLYFGKRFYKFKGLLLFIIITSISYLIPLYLIKLFDLFNLGFIISTLLIFQILATKSLYIETNKVYLALKKGDIKMAKKSLSLLVSRDTKDMKEVDIIRSTIETISENIVDGITSPLFYIFIGGAPLGMLYKAVNTLDSMVGYKNSKYMEFGYFSAKIDDVLNYIPARLTGLLLVIVSFLVGLDYKESYKILLRDKRNHSSPNSGFSEAAVAGALGIQLGGRVSYFGVMHNKPTMGNNYRDPNLGDIKKLYKVLFVTSFIFFSLGLGVLTLCM